MAEFSREWWRYKFALELMSVEVGKGESVCKSTYQTAVQRAIWLLEELERTK